MSRILLIDGHAASRTRTAGILEAAGHQVVAYEAPAAAPEELRPEEFDLVVADFGIPGMPGLPGLELVRRLKLANPQIASLVLTPFPSLEAQTAALVQEVDGYIVEPFLPSELRAAVAEALERRRLIEAGTLELPSQLPGAETHGGLGTWQRRVNKDLLEALAVAPWTAPHEEPPPRQAPGPRAGASAVPRAGDPVRAGPRLEAYGLGEARVLVDGKEIKGRQWHGEKVKELFFYLLSHPGGRTREEVLAALWPELPPEKGGSAFHTALYRLRQAVGPELLVQAGGLYRLNPEVNCRYDVQEFRGLLREAKKLPPGAAARAGKLEAAVALYRGPFLVGFYSEWREALGREIGQEFTGALGWLGEYYASREEYSQAASYLERLLEAEPCDDRACYQLMKSYVLGDPVSARQCYKRHERLVREEMGARPPPALTDLYRSLGPGGSGGR